MKIAVIIPCRNEEKYIAGCLDSIVNCNYPKNSLEVFVCDGMSDDGTVDIIRKYEKNFPFIHVLMNEKKTTPIAFNIGIKNAPLADIVITVSAHAELYPDFFEKVVNGFSISPEIGCVGGVSDNIYTDRISEAIGLAMSSSFGVGNAHFRTGNKEGFVDTVSYPAYKKEVFARIGLFNETLTRNQDDEFNYRLVKSGYKIYLSKLIRSKYYVRGTFKKLSKQYYQYGYWKVYVNKLHKTITSVRQIIPPLFVAFLIIGAIVSLFSLFLAGIYCAILVLYLIAAFVFAGKLNNNIGQMAKIVRCFLILHCSYGYGYIKGILDFNFFSKNPSKKAEELSH